MEGGEELDSDDEKAMAEARQKIECVPLPLRANARNNAPTTRAGARTQPRARANPTGLVHHTSPWEPRVPVGQPHTHQTQRTPG